MNFLEYGIIGLFSLVTHSGFGFPVWLARSQSSIHAISAWRTELHFGCGSRISANVLFLTGAKLAAFRFGRILSNIVVCPSTYSNSFVTLTHLRRQSLKSKPASRHADRTVARAVGWCRKNGCNHTAHPQ